MDGVSIAASLVGIGAAGCQIAIKLYTLATQISTASERVSSISNDVSLTSNVLQELGEFITRETANNDTSIVSPSGLETTKRSAAICENIFKEIEQAVKDASQQIRTKNKFVGKIKLSRSEKAKWPFLQPTIDSLRIDLREAKGTLALMLQLMHLALSRKMAAVHETAPMGVVELREIYRAILAIQKQVQDHDSIHSEVIPVELPDKNTQRPASPRALSKRSSFEEVLSVERISLAPSDHAPPLTPNVFMATSEPGNPELGSPQERKEERIGLNESSMSKNCSSGIEQWTTQSNLQQSPNYYNKTPPLDVKDIGNHLEDHKVLDLFLAKPMLRDIHDGILLTWSILSTQMQKADIEKQLSKDQEQGLPSIAEAYEDLSLYEYKAIGTSTANAGPGTSLVSLKRTHEDITHRGILFKGIPSLQFVLMTDINEQKNDDRRLRARLNDIYSAQGYSDERIQKMSKDGERERRKGQPTQPVDLARPTYVRVHRKWIEPDTLDAYDLPWEWEDQDREYFRIRRWIHQDDQNKLFEHTRLLREDRAHRFESKQSEELKLAEAKGAEVEKEFKSVVEQPLHSSFTFSHYAPLDSDALYGSTQPITSTTDPFATPQKKKAKKGKKMRKQLPGSLDSFPPLFDLDAPYGSTQPITSTTDPFPPPQKKKGKKGKKTRMLGPLDSFNPLSDLDAPYGSTQPITSTTDPFPPPQNKKEKKKKSKRMLGGANVSASDEASNESPVVEHRMMGMPVRRPVPAAKDSDDNDPSSSSRSQARRRELAIPTLAATCRTDESDERSDEESISDDDDLDEEEAEKMVQDLLGKYTTLFQQLPQQQPADPEEGRQQHVEQAATAGADESQTQNEGDEV
ncbi:MAG: hypothetical protein Q9197_001089 [Variospora fuerteventurae]